MKMQGWTRRRFVQAAAAVTQMSAMRKLLGASSLFDRTGAEYVRIAPGGFVMGAGRKIPQAMCEWLTYMTRAELQAMFPHGDPARLVLSDMLFEDGDPDEQPVVATTIHTPFYLGATQVTNRQYEMFDPDHKNLRGKFGFSKGDDEAVIYVSWHEAAAYCEWLAKREGKPYRLPNEAEWEYAARAGTKTLFSTGDSLPDYYLKNARVTDFQTAKDKVSLRVGETPPNPWGLFDMHGNVEEWVEDTYSLRAPIAGSVMDYSQFKVTRGGSHGTFAYYLRSANRSAALPETRGFTIGFRVACGEVEKTRAVVSVPAKSFSDAKVVARTIEDVKRGPDPATPYFVGPRQFVKIPKDEHGVLYHYHNHDTGLAECPNGDLLAIWYSCAREQGRELCVAAGRLRFGAEEWEESKLFWDTPDRNDHCPALWFDGEETLYHLNGTALSHNWEPLQIILRESKDSGVTWSRARYIAPEFGMRNMVCQPIVRLRNGWWIFGADAGQDSTMWLSKDKGETWEDTGGKINGIHAALVEMKDGRIMALGRGDNVDRHLPMSITEDYGKTWKAQATVLPPITYTQRFSMTRLAEGPLVLATFVPNIVELKAQQRTDRELAKLCVMVSYDDGKTWPVRRLLTDDKDDRGVTGMSYGRVYMGPGAAEPTGYVTVTQARNGVIHVISSMNHYAFNLAWIKSAPKNPSPMPVAKKLTAKKMPAVVMGPIQQKRYQAARTLWTNERVGADEHSMATLDIEKGFTAEALVELGAAASDQFILRAYVRSGCTMCNRYWLRVTNDGVWYWYAGDWQRVKDDAAPSASGTYRLAVREDTCVQIYRDGRLLATYPASYEIGFAAPTRGNWMEWEIDVEGREPEVAEVAFDLAGAFGPGAEDVGA
jgi:formylglycine-generating enzyme required for sulfatase activity